MISSSSTRTGLVAAVVVGCLVVGVNVFWCGFVAQESTLYSWDHVAYWSMSSGVAERLFDYPLATLQTVARSISNDELNLLPTLLPAPVLSFAGTSRTAWILTVVNIYALPSLLLGWWVTRRLVANRGSPTSPEQPEYVGLAWLTAVLWFVALWEPVGLGYLGIGGMGLGFIVYGLFFGQPAQSSRERDVRALAIGIALAVLVLFRRWFAFWSLAFCCVVVADAVFHLIRREKSVREVVRQPAIVAAGLLTTLFALAAPRVVTMVQTDYGGRFIHYDSLTSASAEVANIIARFGVLPLLLVMVCGITAAKVRAYRRPILFIAAHLVLTAMFFRQVQDPSPQHWYLVTPGSLVIMAVGLAIIFRRTWLRRSLLAGAVASAGGVAALWPGIPAPLASNVRIEPVVRHDLAEVERLLQFLDGRVAMGSRWVYVLSGMGSLSGSGLGFANWSLGTAHRACAHVLQTDQVDRRDGFPDGLLVADIVLVPVPVQVRGDGSTQRVVSVPAQDFLGRRGIAQAFMPLPVEFALDDGVGVRVFERFRATTQAEIRSLSDQLREHYPDESEIFSPADNSGR